LAIATFCLAAGFSLAWGESLNVAKFGMWKGNLNIRFLGHISQTFAYIIILFKSVLKQIL